MAESKNYAEGHRARLRARILKDPHSAYSYELLESLLGYVHLRSDTKILAKTLLEKYGGIRGLLASHPTERHNIPGCGPATETFLTLLREIIARYFTEAVKGRKSVTVNEIAQLGMSVLADFRMRKFGRRFWTMATDCLLLKESTKDPSVRFYCPLVMPWKLL